MKRENLIKAFKRIMPKNNTKLDMQIKRQRQNAIEYLESLNIDVLSNIEINKAFELDGAF